jgi:hypothetical protein
VVSGQWPSPETLSSRIIENLQEAADAEQDEAQRGKLRAAADVLGGAAREVGTDVLTAVILRATGMA